MDSSFFGTWELDKSKNEGVENLARALGMDDALVEMYKNVSYTYTITPEGDTYRIVADFNGGVHKQEFVIKLGEQQDYTTNEGEQAKVTFTANGHTVVENHVIPSKNLTFVTTRTVNGNVLNMVVEIGDVVAKMFLNKI